MRTKNETINQITIQILGNNVTAYLRVKEVRIHGITTFRMLLTVGPNIIATTSLMDGEGAAHLWAQRELSKLRVELIAKYEADLRGDNAEFIKTIIEA